MKGHEGTVHAIAFNHDGTLLASAGADGTLRLWNVPAGTPRDTLKGHDGEVFAVAFSPDGRLLASGGKDRKVIVWSLGAE